MKNSIPIPPGATDARVLVTGAGGGIGRAVAERLAATAAELWLVGRRREPLEETASGLAARGGAPGRPAIRVHPADVSREDHVEDLAARVAEASGGLDRLVGCAGQAHFAPIEQTLLEDWHAVFAANATGPFLLLKHFGPLLRNGRDPAAVHVASTLGLVGLKNASAYCAAKAALVNLTRVAALEFAPSGVRVNAVCPAVVDTPMLDVDREDGMDGAERRRLLAGHHPVGRIGQPDEIAFVVESLLDPRAGFVTGAVIPVDGGILSGFFE